jgi:hypothetical protein
MSIYHFMFSAKPLPNNPESEECGGAYINCWISSDDRDDAFNIAGEYCDNEGWQIMSIKEEFIASRERYEEIHDSLECYDQAVEFGVSAIFYIWPPDAEDAEEEYD